MTLLPAFLICRITQTRFGLLRAQGDVQPLPQGFVLPIRTGVNLRDQMEEVQMAIDPRRRARQLAKKAATQKAQRAKKRQSGASASGTYGSAEIMRAAAYPLHECLIPENLFKVGIGHVLVTRRLGNRIVVVSFLVDVY